MVKITIQAIIINTHTSVLASVLITVILVLASELPIRLTW